jgi:hypothetical protein
MNERRFAAPKLELIYYQSKHDWRGSLVVYDGEVYRRQDAGPEDPTLESFDEDEYVMVARSRHHSCRYGQYPWDEWEKWAVQDGVPEDLAELGRAVIREADQHGWPEELQAECGWNDSGSAMIELALSDPEHARARWGYLLATDGGRIA